MVPVRPSSTTSDTAPCGQASTGVPQDMASIIARPKGSGQSIGKSSAAALPRNAGFCASVTSPMNSMPGCESSGTIWLWKYSSSCASIFAAMRSRTPPATAMLMARSRPFSGETRPRNAK